MTLVRSRCHRAHALGPARAQRRRPARHVGDPCSRGDGCLILTGSQSAAIETHPIHCEASVAERRCALGSGSVFTREAVSRRPLKLDSHKSNPAERGISILTVRARAGHHCSTRSGTHRPRLRSVNIAPRTARTLRNGTRAVSDCDLRALGRSGRAVSTLGRCPHR